MVVIRKANAYSIVICRLIKKINNVKRSKGEKLVQTLIFPKLPGAYEVFNKEECYAVHNSFYTKRG